MIYNLYRIEKITHDFIKDNLSDYYNYFHSLDMTDIFDNKLEELLGYSGDVIDDSLFKKIAGTDKEALILLDSKEIILSSNTYAGLINNTPRARFSLAHEIGHAILHDENTKNSNIIYFKSRNKSIENIENLIEYQADHFAAALLMPFHHIKNILSFNGTHKHIYKFFNSSQEATRRRIEFVRSKMHEYKF